jgi:hypothetical protein
METKLDKRKLYKSPNVAEMFFNQCSQSLDDKEGDLLWVFNFERGGFKYTFIKNLYKEFNIVGENAKGSRVIALNTAAKWNLLDNIVSNMCAGDPDIRELQIAGDALLMFDALGKMKVKRATLWRFYQLLTNIDNLELMAHMDIENNTVHLGMLKDYLEFAGVKNHNLDYLYKTAPEICTLMSKLMTNEILLCSNIYRDDNKNQWINTGLIRKVRKPKKTSDKVAL